MDKGLACERLLAPRQVADVLWTSLRPDYETFNLCFIRRLYLLNRAP